MTVAATRSKAKPKVSATRGGALKLDLGCGQHKREGYIGVDIADGEGVDIVHDLRQYPWPWKDRSVAAIHTSHYVEHIPMDLPDDRDGLCAFMDECWRVLRKGGKLEIIHPYLKSVRAFQDPTHRRFIPAETWTYFDRQWREAMGLDHYPIACDFEVTPAVAAGIPDHVMARPDETRAYMMAHDWETIADLHVTLIARK